MTKIEESLPNCTQLFEITSTSENIALVIPGNNINEREKNKTNI